MVFVIILAAGLARVAQHLDGAAVVAPQVIEPGDVIVGLRNQAGHAVLLAELAGLLVRGQSAGEFIERDLTGRDVAQYRSGGFGVGVQEKLFMGPLVACQGFCEAVLTMVDVADVDIEPGNTPAVSAGLENSPRFCGRGEGFVVLAQ